MRFYVIAGEASGDLHGSDLIREIKSRLPQSEFRAWGGDLMQAEGAEIVKHYRDLAFMGFTEVILNLKTILNNISFCKADILVYKPDAIILVDYPGFNLRIAEFANKNGIPVYYYISPQVWAWKSSRVWKIKRVVNKMFVILPFEKDFYKKYDYNVEYVGHPLPDVVSRYKKQFTDQSVFLKKYSLDDRPVVALLPGSRKQEISTMLPLMLSVRSMFPGYQFVVAGAPSQPLEYYKQFIVDRDVKIISGATYELLNFSKAALVTSGTATLETALMNVPQVVCYKGGTVSYFIARSLVNIKYISLVNLIMDKEVVKELIQNDLNTTSLEVELKKILDPDNRLKIFADYQLLSEKLSGGGAAWRTAEGIISDLKNL
jgi:lipid-A-disaccharide synthase